MATSTKQCSRCEQRRPLGDFYRRRASGDGLGPLCKGCSQARNAASRRRYKQLNAVRDVRALTPAKACRVCKQSRPSAEYALASDKRDGLGDICRDCHAAQRREAYESRPAEARREMNLRRFGLNATDYDAMLAAQGGVCAICASAQPRGRWNTHFAVDHDHKSGRVRGLLCGTCNTALGMAKDNPELLRAAADYLERA